MYILYSLTEWFLQNLKKKIGRLLPQTSSRAQPNIWSRCPPQENRLLLETAYSSLLFWSVLHIQIEKVKTRKQPSRNGLLSKYLDFEVWYHNEPGNTRNIFPEETNMHQSCESNDSLLIYNPTKFFLSASEVRGTKEECAQLGVSHRQQIFSKVHLYLNKTRP